MSTHNMFFMEDWRKLYINYGQILLLNSSGVPKKICLGAKFSKLIVFFSDSIR